MALMLLERDRSGGLKLAPGVDRRDGRVGHCRQCRTLSEEELCPQCADPRRDDSLLCVVEGPSGRIAVEQTGYRGRYFVLKGHLSPLDGLGPEAIGIPELEARIRDGAFSEVIRHQPHRRRRGHRPLYRPATGRPRPDLSRIAHGVPLGGELELVDGGSFGPRPGRTAADLLSSVPPVSVGRAAYTPSPMASFPVLKPSKR